jgi:hypothetical protein
LIYVLCGLIVTVSLAGALWGAWERQHQDPWHKLLTQARQAMVQAGIAVPAQSSPRQLAQALQSQSDARLQRPDLQRWLLQLEALRYAPQTGHPSGAPSSTHSSKSRQLGAQTRRRIATLQRELTRLLPLRTP